MTRCQFLKNINKNQQLLTFIEKNLVVDFIKRMHSQADFIKYFKYVI